MQQQLLGMANAALPIRRPAESNAMIATRSEGFPTDSDGPDRRVDNRSNVPVSTTNTSPRSVNQSGQRSKSLGAGTCLMLLLVSGLIRTVINSHFGNQPRQASPVAKRQAEESARQFFDSLRTMPPLQRALMKLNLSDAIIKMDPKN